MNKTVSLILFAVLLSVPALLIAKEQDKTMGTCSACEQGSTEKQGLVSGCREPGMRPMMGRQMVATSDGGVIVMAGDKLFKYDKNLNLVKETEINIEPDEDEMNESMEEKATPKK